MSKIIFYRGHMIKAGIDGVITVKRITPSGQVSAIYTFERPLFCLNDALAWAKRWVMEVVYNV